MEELVSIIVLIYNSEEFIVETLESIVNQSYKNIEIILSDDFSTDNSIKVAKDYLDSIEFKEYAIASNKKNMGIPANCNNGINKAKGTYIKLIAADDILLKDCIKSNVEFMEKNNNNIQYSKLVNFEYIDGQVIKSNSDFKFYSKMNDYTVDKQFRMMAFENFIPAPTVFLKRNIFEKYGCFNEKYKLIEDYPMWVKILHNREKVYFLNETTILYRKHNNSLSNSSEKHINENMFNYYKEYINTEFKNYLLKEKKYLYLYHKKIELLKMEKIIKNGNVKGVSEKNIKFYNLIDPLWILNELKSFFKTKN